MIILLNLILITAIPSFSLGPPYFLHEDPSDPFIFTPDTVYVDTNGFPMEQDVTYYHQVDLTADTIYFFNWEYQTEYLTFNITSADGLTPVFYSSNLLWGSRCLIFSVNRTTTYNLTIKASQGVYILTSGLGFFPIQQHTMNILISAQYEWTSNFFSIAQCPIVADKYLTYVSFAPVYFLKWNYSENCISYIVDYNNCPVLSTTGTDISPSGQYIFLTEDQVMVVDKADNTPGGDPGEEEEDEHEPFNLWWILPIVGACLGITFVILKVKFNRNVQSKAKENQNKENIK